MREIRGRESEGDRKKEMETERSGRETERSGREAGRPAPDCGFKAVLLLEREEGRAARDQGATDEAAHRGDYYCCLRRRG